MRKTIILLLAVLLFVPSFISPKTADFDPVVDNWYKVEDWEIEVCSKWGGTAEAQTYSSTATGSAYMFSTTVTLQGEKSISGEEENSTNTTLYEAAWYFRPMGSQQEYSVLFTGDGTETIYEGSASPERGDANYHAEESTKEYTSVKIKYETGTLTVPIVEK